MGAPAQDFILKSKVFVGTYNYVNHKFSSQFFSPTHQILCIYIYTIVGWLSAFFVTRRTKVLKKFPLIPWHVNISLRTGSTKMRKLTKLYTHIFSLAKITTNVSFMTSQRFWSFSSTPFILHGENSVQTKFLKSKARLIREV